MIRNLPWRNNWVSSMGWLNDRIFPANLQLYTYRGWGPVRAKDLGESVLSSLIACVFLSVLCSWGRKFKPVTSSPVIVCFRFVFLKALVGWCPPWCFHLTIVSLHNLTSSCISDFQDSQGCEAFRECQGNPVLLVPRVYQVMILH